jgi:hypothetical protein
LPFVSVALLTNLQGQATASKSEAPSVQTGSITVGGTCNPVIIDPKQPITIVCDSKGLTLQQIEAQRKEYAQILTSVRLSGLKLDQVLELEKQILANQKSTSESVELQSQFEEVQSFINGAERGEGQSFDGLRLVMYMENASQELRESARKEYFRVIKKYSDEEYIRHPLPGYPKIKLPDSELIHLIGDEDEKLRRQALDSADVAFIRRYLDAVFLLLGHDSSLTVRDAAFHRFAEATGVNPEQFFLFPDTDAIETWWAHNRRRFVAEDSVMFWFRPR